MTYRWLLLTTCIATLLSGARPAAAQGNFMSLTTFELSAPLGDTKRYVNSAIGPGLGWEGRWTVNTRASAG